MFEIFRANGLWYWQLKSGNQVIVAKSVHGYKTLSNANRAVIAMDRTMWFAMKAPVKFVD